MMASKRLKTAPHFVVHNTNWSDLFHLLPSQEAWSFSLGTTQCIPGRDAWTVEVFSPTECRKLVELTELLGYENCGYSKDYRNNTRTITSDPMFAAELFDRIKHAFPSRYLCDGQVWELSGLNERFRWCKYEESEKFEMHCD